ncbi:MAG: ABC-F family ATP-binding cassette domain-containing protein [Rikenellaceae bacterium]
MVNYLTVENLTKSYGDVVLFEKIGFTIGEGERVGLIARNGAGKSTLLAAIMSGEDLEGGEVTFRRDLRVAHLVQEPKFAPEMTIWDVCQIGAIEGDEMEQLNREVRMKQILSRLKITNLDRKVGVLSGGEQKRVALAGALINEPELLILDEPTNHLDLDVTLWLENYLKGSRISILMVTHDRYFLDRVCNRILEIDEKKIFSYKGNYSYYLEKREERKAAAAHQQANDANLYRKELEWMRRQPQARATKAKSRIESFYDLEDRLRKERDQGQVKLDMKATYIGKKIYEVEGLNKAFDDKVILKDFSYTFSRYEKMGIVGENGVGKSTFIKMLMGEVAPDSGKIDVGQTVRFGYYSQSGIKFNDNTKVIDVVTDIAESIDLGDGRKMTASQLLQHFLFEPKTQHNFVGRLSGGERRRLYLCTILMQNPNFLILDEPTNDLDIMTLQVLEDYLQSFSGCVMVVSHDRYFMDKVADHLLVFEGEGRTKDFPSSYTDYLVWKELKEQQTAPANTMTSTAKKVEVVAADVNKPQSTKLSYKEKRELESIDVELPKLEEQKAQLETELNSGALSVEELTEKSEQISAIMEQIDEMSMRWLELSERA